jgi:hypothetical protein
MKEVRLRELISEGSTANIDFPMRNWNKKQYIELKQIFLSSGQTSFNYIGGGSGGGLSPDLINFLFGEFQLQTCFFRLNSSFPILALTFVWIESCRRRRSFWRNWKSSNPDSSSLQFRRWQIRTRQVGGLTYFTNLTLRVPFPVLAGMVLHN